MKVMVVGGGAREHALIFNLSKSEKVDTIFVNTVNSGILNEKKVVSIQSNTIDEMVSFAKYNKIDLTICGPENPLMEGIGDKFREANLLIFAPNKDEALLEGSKEFAKNFMKKYGVSSASSKAFTDYDKAIEYLEKSSYPIVLKADGLCAGKGVRIVENKEEAKETLYNMMKGKIFNDAASCVVIEDFMKGKEISILSIYDGNNIYPLLSSMDHKKVFEGEIGPNTGGMGTIAPNPYYNKEVEDDFIKNVLKPTLEGLKEENFVTPACIFFGLMLTEDGLKCMEYNMRFGDPETQSVLSLLEGDLFDILYKATNGTLKSEDIKFKDAVAVTVVGAAKGYPGKYLKDIELNFPKVEDIKIFIAGAYEKDNKILSSGGRVFNLTSVAKNKEEAREKIYDYLKKMNNENIHYRKDIGNV